MRTRLYHKDEPMGKIFTSKKEVDAALEEGWKEAPWLIHEVEPAAKKPPGRPKKEKDK